jgi:hypothetical protein
MLLLLPLLLPLLLSLLQLVHSPAHLDAIWRRYF